ncbi:MAG: type II secretion system F family protein [Thermoplasmata archaeon]|nr:type II secretion system F family protein [Thermoplasmata archaeon]
MALPTATATTTIRARPKAPPPPPRSVRVPKGERPAHSGLNSFQQWAWKTFKRSVIAKPPDPLLEESLLKAHMRIRSDEYLAVVYAETLIAGIALAVTGVLLGSFLAFSNGSPVLGLVAGVVLPVLLTPMLFVLLRGQPSSKAKSRGREIDRRISVAMNFMSAMSSADVNIDQIFAELGRQKKIYGEVAEEAAWITRDTELLGVDILTAIKEGATRSPSKRFQDFLQGVVTTATSGGQLKPYFLLKAEQYEAENKLSLLQRTETMGLMAEVFVIGVVAFPLFLVIILAIFAIIGGNGAFVLQLLWAIVALLIPLSEVGFIFAMNTFATEA